MKTDTPPKVDRGGGKEATGSQRPRRTVLGRVEQKQDSVRRLPVDAPKTGRRKI